MKEFKLFSIVLLMAPFALFSQSNSPIQLGSKKISTEEFLKTYTSLVESDSVTKENQAAFLSDYIDYQLKVLIPR